MLEEGSFDLCRRKAMPGHVHNVVDAPSDPIEALVVSGSSIAGELLSISAYLVHFGRFPHSILCKGSNTCRYSACARPRLYAPCLARAS